MRRVLITGAAGNIGTVLRAGLGGRYHLRLLDAAEQKPAGDGEEVVTADLNDRAAVRAALEGMDAVVHLAAIPSEAPFDDILHANIAGTYAVFEGARQAGVRRIVFASSHHATGFYPSGQKVGPDLPVRPDTYYGVSKAFGEALGSLYHDKHGLEVVALRIGAFLDRPTEHRHLANWLSHGDAVQLVGRALEAPDVGFLVVYGASANTRLAYGTQGWDRLGYAPQDDAERHAAETQAHPPDRFHGAHFVDY